MTKMNWNATKQRAADNGTQDAELKDNAFLRKRPEPAHAKPKRKRLEHWQAAKTRERQERRELATPLLKGVTEPETSRLIRKT